MMILWFHMNIFEFILFGFTQLPEFLGLYILPNLGEF